MAFPESRSRRLRRTEALRRVARETRVDPSDLIYPFFCVEGRGVREPVASMPGVDRFSVDLLAQSGVVFRRRVSGDGQAPRLEMEKLEIDPEDALLAQLRAFVEAVRTRRGPPVSGGEALAALRTALRVVEAIPPFDELL